MSNVKVKESPALIIPESNVLLGPFSGFPDVTVCGSVSSFVQVTVFPTATFAGGYGGNEDDGGIIGLCGGIENDDGGDRGIGLKGICDGGTF